MAALEMQAIKGCGKKGDVRWKCPLRGCFASAKTRRCNRCGVDLSTPLELKVFALPAPPPPFSRCTALVPYDEKKWAVVPYKG